MESIRQIRKEVGMKQRELAERLDMIQQNYSNMENGTYVPHDIKDKRKKALKILMPLLVEKIMEVRADLNRLEYLSLNK